MSRINMEDVWIVSLASRRIGVRFTSRLVMVMEVGFQLRDDGSFLRYNN